MNSTPRRAIGLLATALCLLACTGSARAQGQVGDRPYQRPTTSPYLNLLRGQSGGGTALRYYGVVRPEQQLYRAADQSRRGISDINRRIDEQQTPGARSLETSILSPTGHATTFFSTGQYYPGAQQRR